MSLTVLIILDGWGVAPPSSGNAITQAKTPNISSYLKQYPNATLKAHGKYVGLPENQAGNSEAGHMNLGAGRRVEQDSVIISKSIQDGTFFKNPAFEEAILHTKRNNSTLHLIGILSGQNCPHSSPDHLKALLGLVLKEGVLKIALHLFTDGRDAPPKSALTFFQDLKQYLPKQAHIATIAGRFYLDRKKKWGRVEKIYNALTLGEAPYSVDSPEDAINQAYARGENDEFIQPTLIKNFSCVIEDQDSVIFFNLRSDRARQLTRAFVQDDFDGFHRRREVKNMKFVAMTDFGPDLPNILTAFPSIDLKNTLPVVLKNLRQLYIAEAEKYSHITYFFNGGYAEPVAGEERIYIPSLDLKFYNDKPEMRANEIASEVISNIEKNKFDFIVLNFANADMLGHTGDIEAAKKGIDVVDGCVSQIAMKVLGRGGTLIVTGDHGNAEEMLRENTTDVNTEHSTNPVPFILISHEWTNKKIVQREDALLADVAPTILKLLGIEKPREMTGQELI